MDRLLRLTPDIISLELYKWLPLPSGRQVFLRHYSTASEPDLQLFFPRLPSVSPLSSAQNGRPNSEILLVRALRSKSTR